MTKVCETHCALSSPEMRPAMNPSFWFRGSSDGCPVWRTMSIPIAGGVFNNCFPMGPNHQDTTCHHKIIEYSNEMLRKLQEKFQLLNVTVWTYWGAQTLTQTADCLLIFQMENIFRSASFAFPRSLPHPSLPMPGWKSILHPSNGSRWWASWVSGNLQDLKGWKKDDFHTF